MALPAERTAFQALSRRFGACLIPGQRLGANSLTLRPLARRGALSARPRAATRRGRLTTGIKRLFRGRRIGLSCPSWARSPDAESAMKHILFALAAGAAGVGRRRPPPPRRPPPAAYEAGRCLVAQDRRAAVACMARLPLGDTAADLGGVAAGRAFVTAGASSRCSCAARSPRRCSIRDFRGSSASRSTTADRDLNLPVELGAPPDRTIRLYSWGDCVVRNDAAGIDRCCARDRLGRRACRAWGLQTYMSNCMRDGQQLSVRRGRCAACSRRRSITCSIATGPASCRAPAASQSLSQPGRGFEMKLFATVAAFAALVAAPRCRRSLRRSAATAQTPRAVGTAQPATPAPRRAARRRFCLVGRDAAAADVLLATAPYSPEERTEATRAAAARCSAASAQRHHELGAADPRRASPKRCSKRASRRPQPARSPALDAAAAAQVDARHDPHRRRALRARLCAGRMHRAAQHPGAGPRLARDRAGQPRRGGRHHRAQPGLRRLRHPGTPAQHRRADAARHARRGSLPLVGRPARRAGLALGSPPAGARAAAPPAAFAAAGQIRRASPLSARGLSV